MPTLASNPELAINKVIAQLDPNETQWLCVRYDFLPYYLSSPTLIELLAIVEMDASGIRFLSVGEQTSHAIELCEKVDSHELMHRAAEAFRWPIINCREPIKLAPIAIAKPWGQEIWYTGIEERGQSKITDGKNSIPLPWFLSAAPTHLAGERHQQLNLLKILDPLPEPVFGDLYFELHEEKQEVYVVTNVASKAWPNQRGKIKIGFDQSVRSEFPSDDSFIEAFAGAVKQYELIRRRIDQQLDALRIENGVGLNEPVPAEQTKQWLTHIDCELREKEEMLRAEMDRFKGSLDLSVGDVLKVPCLTPHSLMHGVRTIEFQTPVYERKIVSFAQKVLTQDTWDTDAATGCMNLGDHKLQALKPTKKTENILIEEVVDFSDFTVSRITLAPSARFELPKLADYALAIGVKGSANIGADRIGPEQGVLLPKTMGTLLVQNSTAHETVLLVSIPK